MRALVVAVAASLVISGCATAPPTYSERKGIFADGVVTKRNAWRLFLVVAFSCALAYQKNRGGGNDAYPYLAIPQPEPAEDFDHDDRPAYCDQPRNELLHECT